MPIASILLVKGHAPDRLQGVVKGVNDVMVRVTNAPRTTVWIEEIDPQRWAAQGVPAAELLRTKPLSEIDSPLVTVVMIKGRPVEQHRELIAGITEVLVNELRLDPKAVRVNVLETPAESFGIGGLQANVFFERMK
ncbi:MAG: hypothetical protein LKCHEGNO_01469 [Burkholderiaceae bacterium]|nr:hypothetical protein [Burkholderiaceae bacterium]